jgi:hypothetical protein
MRTRLYAPEDPNIVTPPPLIPLRPDEPLPAWTPPPPPKVIVKVKKKFSWTVLFLGASAVFFFISVAASFLFLFHGGLTVSNNNVLITVQPSSSSIASGGTVQLLVTIENKNPAPISNADLSMDFPDGTLSADDLTSPLPRYVGTFGTIPAGATVTRTVQAVFFGSVNQSLSIPVSLQYNTPNSNALFTKDQNTALTITSSPLTISAQSISSVAPGQPFTIALSVRSNATTPLTNIAVSAEYPQGFTAQKVQLQNQSKTAQNITPTSAQPSFTIGTLAPGQQASIYITGIITGTDNDQKSFQFTVGTLKTDGSAGLAVAYASQTTNITVSKPFLAVSLSLNHGNTDPTVVVAGDPVSGMVTWINSLTTSLTNAQVSIALSGNAFDPSSVSTANGYFDSADNTLLYTSQTDNSLALLNSNNTGNGIFSLSTKSGTELAGITNPVIKLAVTVSGQPTGGTVETITNTLINTIEVATNLELASKIVHASGPFQNSGPVPPVPNQPTTYTVELSVSNTVNSVAGATATMILPPYVTFTGNMSPRDGSLSYNQTTHTVTWKIGDVDAGVGNKTPATTAAFQISFVPSTTQSGSSPILVGNQTLIGTDRFTEAQVGNTAPALTTQTTSDPSYNTAFGTVGN